MGDWHGMNGLDPPHGMVTSNLNEVAIHLVLEVGHRIWVDQVDTVNMGRLGFIERRHS